MRPLRAPSLLAISYISPLVHLLLQTPADLLTCSIHSMAACGSPSALLPRAIPTARGPARAPARAQV
eukprot:6151604-Pleurochrysis_carterae.AAC.2